MESAPLVVEPTDVTYARQVLHDVKHGVPKVYDARGTHLSCVAALIERLESALEVERALKADAHAQLAAFRQDSAYLAGWKVGYRQAKEEGAL